MKTVLKDNELLVKITYCPAVKHLKATGREVSPWYRYTTEVVMETLANSVGYEFEMETYDENTGAALYSIKKQINDQIEVGAVVLQKFVRN